MGHFQKMPLGKAKTEGDNRLIFNELDHPPTYK
nr:MAG TPA: hypothetical protein [Caudoviricetes sp.]